MTAIDAVCGTIGVLRWPDEDDVPGFRAVAEAFYERCHPSPSGHPPGPIGRSRPQP